MRSDIRTFVQTCVKCQQAKAIRLNRAPLHSLKAPNKRFSHNHIDIVGPLTGFPWSLLPFVHHLRFYQTRRVVPLRDVTAIECANAFLLHWVRRFGYPAQMISDRGWQFTSYQWKEMCKFLGTTLSHTTAYPRPMGWLKAFIIRLKQRLNTTIITPPGTKISASFYLVSTPW